MESDKDEVDDALEYSRRVWVISCETIMGRTGHRATYVIRGTVVMEHETMKCGRCSPTYQLNTCRRDKTSWDTVVKLRCLWIRQCPLSTTIGALLELRGILVITSVTLECVVRVPKGSHD